MKKLLLIFFIILPFNAWSEFKPTLFSGANFNLSGALSKYSVGYSSWLAQYLLIGLGFEGQIYYTDNFGFFCSVNANANIGGNVSLNASTSSGSIISVTSSITSGSMITVTPGLAYDFKLSKFNNMETDLFLGLGPSFNFISAGEGNQLTLSQSSIGAGLSMLSILPITESWGFGVGADIGVFPFSTANTINGSDQKSNFLLTYSTSPSLGVTYKF